MNTRTATFAAMLLCAAAVHAQHANMPIVCPNPTAVGLGMSGCGQPEVYAEGTPTTVVRTCPTSTCTYAERRWKALGSVSVVEFVEVCTVVKTINGAVTGCSKSAATPTAWDAMAMVPPSQVERTSSPTPQFPGTFTLTQSSDTAPAVVTLTWDASSFTGGACTATGSWAGTKALQGTQTISNVTANASYTLTCSRADPNAGMAQLMWTNPTTNTSGSALTDLAGTRIVYGQSATALTQVVEINNPSAAAYTILNLAPSTWFFAAKSFTTSGNESSLSNIASKVVGATQTQTYALTREAVVTTKPNPPTLQVVEPIVYNAVADYSLLAFRTSTRYGTVALGTPCDTNKAIRASFYAIPATAVRWSSTGRTKYPVAKCAVL